MGTSKNYICDQCGLELRLNTSQPAAGNCIISEKYCPRTDQIIEITSEWNSDEETICCVDYKKRKSRSARAGIANCHLKKCNGDCLEELIILAYDESDDAAEYKCPRHNCEGKMKVDPEWGTMFWD